MRFLHLFCSPHFDFTIIFSILFFASFFILADPMNNTTIRRWHVSRVWKSLINTCALCSTTMVDAITKVSYGRNHSRSVSAFVRTFGRWWTPKQINHHQSLSTPADWFWLPPLWLHLHCFLFFIRRFNCFPRPISHLLLELCAKHTDWIINCN